MKMFPAKQWVHAIALGMFFACLGFSYAIATAGSRGIGGRAIGVDCARPPVQFVTDSDLGLVVVGSQFTRQILVRFGFTPHSFLFGPNTDTTLPLEISDNGELTGTPESPGRTDFDVRVVDFVDGKFTAPVTKSFFFNAVDARTDPRLSLRLINSPTLPDAVAHEPYAFSIQANGGTPPYTFSFVSDTDMNALPVGLALDPETGLLTGSPTVPTTAPASFAIQVTDTLQTVARQTFLLNVQAGTISSDFIALGGNFKLQYGKVSADSLQLTLVLNKSDLARNKILRTEDLEGLSFEMQFGSVTLPPTASTDPKDPSSGANFTSTFNKHGEIKFPNFFDGLPPAGLTTRYKISFNPKTAMLRVNFTGISMIKGIGANFNSFKNIIPASIKIGSSSSGNNGGSNDGQTGIDIAKTDVIKFDFNRRGGIAKGNARATTKDAPAGLFLITKVTGTEKQVEVLVDPKDPTKGFAHPDRLFLTMTGIAKQVGGGPINFGVGDQVSILLGTECLGHFPASSFTNDNGKLTFVNEDPNAAHLHTLIIDPKKGSIFIDTHGVDPKSLFDVDVLVAGEPLVMTVTLTITNNSGAPAYDAQSEVTVFRKGDAIQNK